MIDIFLSASVPLPDRDRRFFETADVLSIREAIKALVEVVLPIGRITCGGHPAITPLLTLFAREAALDRDRITIYQTERFRAVIPLETFEFSDVRFTPEVEQNRERSLTLMRETMIQARNYDAAVIIGGMEGIFEEFEIFKQSHAYAEILPIASTGAAAALVHQRGAYAADLVTELTYSTLFRRRFAKLDSRW